jgi:hypothetical protein
MKKEELTRLTSCSNQIKNIYHSPTIHLQTVILEESVCTGSTEVRFSSEGTDNTLLIELWDQNTGWSQTKDFDL